MQERLKNIQEVVRSKGLDAILISKPENRFYLSGFTGSSGFLIISPEEAYLVTDFRYIEQAQQQVECFKVIKHETPAFKTINNLLKELDISKLGFEANHLTFEQYTSFNENLECSLIPQKNIVEELRKVKSVEEVKKIKKAAEISEKAFESILAKIKPGVTEKELALELEFSMKKMGAESLSFDIIVASGKRSSLPHGRATNKKIEEGDLITFDFGCKHDSYCSDMTRTVVLGKPSEEQVNIYYTVLAAQQKALQRIKAGMKAAEIDSIAREVITSAGYGDYFGHGLGHGVGLEIHEAPRLSKEGDETLQPGMVVTIEPGIYMPDFGGVRIEDIVVITENGCNNLNTFTKELIKL